MQRRLESASEALLDHGVLYPAPGWEEAVGHEFLVAVLDFERTAPRLMAQRLGADGVLARRMFEAEWSNLAEQVARHAPTTVVLSTERLLSRLTPELAPDFCAMLFGLFDPVTVVAYLRRPSHGLLSNLQQHVKFDDTLPPIAPPPFRTWLEPWDEAFPGALRLMVYDRAQLVRGDIVADFLSRAVGIDPDSLPLPAASPVNAGMSAEAAHLMQWFRRRECPGFVGWNRASSEFMAALRVADDADPPVGLTPLRPGLAEWLDLSCTDLLWLKDRFGLTFSGIDLAAVGPRGPLPYQFDTVRDVAVLDEARLSRLNRAILGPEAESP